MLHDRLQHGEPEDYVSVVIVQTNTGCEYCSYLKVEKT